MFSNWKRTFQSGKNYGHFCSLLLQVKDALLEVQSVKCPESLTNPRGTTYEEDFEDQGGNNIATDEKPFCGKRSKKNDVVLFREGGGNPTINILFYGKVSIQYNLIN